MSTEEPIAKKAKTATDGTAPTGWENHKMNVSEALMKVDENRHFADLATADILCIQGIGPLAARVMDVLKIKTIDELANYKFYKWAKAIKTLSEYESEGGRLEGSVMNVDKALDKEHEDKSLKEICELPIGALEGLTDDANSLLESFGVKSIGDLAELKYCKLAEAILIAAEVENTLTEKERKVEAALKKLA